MVKDLLNKAKRFILEQRIEMTRADIAIAVQRRDDARLTVASAEAFVFAAQRKLHGLRSRLLLTERPNALLAEALRHE